MHFVKKRMWFLETALSLLEGEEMSEFEKYRSSEDRRHESEQSSTIPGTSSVIPYATQRESLRFRSWHMR